VLWTPSPDADANLIAEGIAAERITRVGNIMIDSLEMVRGAIEAADAPAALGLEPGYCLVTLHRPSNVDDPAQLARLADALVAVQGERQIVFPVHPRTAQRLETFGLRSRLEEAGARLIEPQPYIRFMSLVMGASALVTDSGGIQEETTYLGIPCLTLRANTERPITITQGTNRLVGHDNLVGELAGALEMRGSHPRPELWDGRTAARCVADLRERSSR
jgi:UDP-N-acetylglucosamine 2-epimerase (non-hydrolysing)